MRLNPYLILDGTAMEAVRFYEKALEAKNEGVVTFGEMPGDPNQPPMPDAAKGLVAHACLRVGDTSLMLSDAFPGQPVHGGDNVHVMIMASNTDEARKVFDALSAGGHVFMPLTKTHWSPAYGMLKDKYGVMFQVSTEQAAQ